MLLLIFLSSMLFASPDYYVITAGNLFETYDTCYVELKYDESTPSIVKAFCSDDFILSQKYDDKEKEISLSWSFYRTISKTVDRSTRYGEIFTATETYNLSDSDTCSINVSNGFSWLIEQGLFGCGMSKVIR